MSSLHLRHKQNRRDKIFNYGRKINFLLRELTKMKKTLFILTLILTYIWSFSIKADFVEGLEDIPLPSGVTQVENGSISFGNEEIRLFEAYLSAEKQKFDTITKFYIDTLPQMGWQKSLKNAQKISFERDGETLEISKESEKPLILRLVVKSKNQ